MNKKKERKLKIKEGISSFKEFWIKVISANVLWFVIPTTFAIVIFTAWYTWPLSLKSEDHVRIYQLAITALAGTVGIGTVINSSRSTKISAESMNTTKQKEIREQSSHLILVSSFDYFKNSAPFYKEAIAYEFPSDDLSGEYRILSKENIRDSQMQRVNFIQSKRYIPNKSDHCLKMINTGKGTCVNLEYKFIFNNNHEYKDHMIEKPNKILTSVLDLPSSYYLSVKELDTELFAEFTDVNLKRYLDSAISIHYDSDLISHKFCLKKEYLTQYIDILSPSDQIEIKIPNEFIVMCKHYEFIRNLKVNRFSDSLKNYSRHLMKNDPIKPIGEIHFTYYDESLIRTGEYLPEEKSMMKYQVVLKDIDVLANDENLRYYLEVNLLETENISWNS